MTFTRNQPVTFRFAGTGAPQPAIVADHAPGARWAAILLGQERARKLVLASDLSPAAD